MRYLFSPCIARAAGNCHQIAQEELGSVGVGPGVPGHQAASGFVPNRKTYHQGSTHDLDTTLQ